jgi:hypothetical protein
MPSADVSRGAFGNSGPEFSSSRRRHESLKGKTRRKASRLLERYLYLYLYLYRHLYRVLNGYLEVVPGPVRKGR